MGKAQSGFLAGDERQRLAVQSRAIVDGEPRDPRQLGPGQHERGGRSVRRAQPMEARARQNKARPPARKSRERGHAGAVEPFDRRREQRGLRGFDDDRPARPKFGDRPFRRELVARNAAHQTVDTHSEPNSCRRFAGLLCGQYSVRVPGRRQSTGA